MNNQTPHEVLAKFYNDNNLGEDGGINNSSVRIDMSPHFHFYYPNFDARRKAVLKHDIHHLLTGYSTNIKGEYEISAWEIASGCKKYWAAFILDTSGLMLGIAFYFWGTLKAFSRGRRTKNLYDDRISDQQALNTNISDLRSQLLLDKFSKETKPTFVDFILFLMFALYGLLISIASIVLLPLIIIYTIYLNNKSNPISSKQ
jgi:ubiquinone biosynthesis protein Coq4